MLTHSDDEHEIREVAGVVGEVAVIRGGGGPSGRRWSASGDGGACVGDTWVIVPCEGQKSVILFIIF
jgi:hypothetical protein